MGNVVGIALLVGFIALFGFLIFITVKNTKRQREKDEALFVTMFPDLQPYYHPAKLFEYVAARLAKPPSRVGTDWKNPPGFGVAAAQIEYEGEREVVRLLDSARTLLTQFTFETHPEGGVIRFGRGKFTIDTRVKGQPRVRYWHPDREFKWTPQGWRFQTRVTDQPIDTSDRSSWSSDSSSSSAARGAAAAGLAGAGGTFDGGGASQGWSDGGRGEASGAGSSGSTASATSY
jgi:uncharacterized membrane protein YgcG